MSKLPYRTGVRHFSAKAKVTISNEVNRLLDDGIMKHRKHPGVVKPHTVLLPGWVVQSIKRILQEEPEALVKNLHNDGKILAQHLHGRRTPVEEEELRRKVHKVEKILGTNFTTNNTRSADRHRATLLLKENVYNWKPIQYNRRHGLSYIFGRSAQDYAVVYRTLNEIYTNDKDFRPKTLFDFGSGIGTVLWAASQLWSKSLQEYICIDASREMNDLSEELCHDADPIIKTVYYRQFLPALPNPTADIVVSAYSLLELPNAKARLDTVRKLWNKTESYLVVIEHGTNAGFGVVNEARDFILNCSNDTTTEDELRQAAHVFSPCPHDISCPRYTTDDTPCNFEVSYFTLPFPRRSAHQTERYAYIVLKKGKRSEDDEQWPRVVRPVLKRSNHTICRMCAASGELQEVIFTKSKHGRNVYRCARSSTWGDRLPLRLEKVPPTTTADAKVVQGGGDDNTATNVS